MTKKVCVTIATLFFGLAGFANVNAMNSLGNHHEACENCDDSCGCSEDCSCGEDCGCHEELSE